MSFNADTTASTQNRHVSVLKSKYDIYSLSGGIIIDVISARKKAITVTIFFLINAIKKEE